MKIALICTEKLPVPPVAGGAVQLYINEILPYISKEHDITVISKDHPTLVREEIIDNVRFLRVPARNTLRYVRNVKELLDDSYDLIHVFNRPKWVLDLSENLPNTRFSLSLHNEMFLPDKITPEKAVQCINRVEFINTVSKFIANGVKKLYPIGEGKLRVVYSGVNTEKYSTNWSHEGIANRMIIKDRLGIKDKKVVLHVSRFSPKKGNHIVLAAMRKLMENRKDTALVLIGSKWYGKNEEDDFTKYCKDLAKQIDGPVVFTGFIPPSEIPAYYNIGDVFVCASQWNEPLARIHYEAMAAGLPIITTDRGGNAEVFEHHVNGLVVEDYNNPDAFTDYISYLLSNPQKAAEMGQKARETALLRFTWKRVTDEVLAPVKSFSKRVAAKDEKLPKNQTSDKEKDKKTNSSVKEKSNQQNDYSDFFPADAF